MAKKAGNRENNTFARTVNKVHKNNSPKIIFRGGRAGK